MIRNGIVAFVLQIEDKDVSIYIILVFEAFRDFWGVNCAF